MEPRGFGYEKLGKIERGDVPLQREDAVVIAAVLNVSPEAFYTPPSSETQLDRVERRLEELATAIDELRDGIYAEQARILGLLIPRREAAAAAQTDLPGPPEGGVLERATQDDPPTRATRRSTGRAAASGRQAGRRKPA